MFVVHENLANYLWFINIINNFCLRECDNSRDCARQV